MSGYIEAGYVIVLGTLASYGSSLVIRERSAKRRLSASVLSKKKETLNEPVEAESVASDEPGGPQ